MTLERDSIIVQELHFDNLFTAYLYDNGIVEIVWDKIIEKVEVVHIKKIKEVLFQFGKGKKMPILMTFHDFLSVDKKASKYSETGGSSEYTLAHALVIDNLAKRILFNYYVRFTKSKRPIKGFSNKEDAFKWLLDIKREHED